MTDKREQVAKQCEVVCHLANALRHIHRDHANMLRSEAADILIEQIGNRTAYIMETLGNILNGMDAVDPKEDAWVDPIFREAQRLWPQRT